MTVKAERNAASLENKLTKLYDGVAVVQVFADDYHQICVWVESSTDPDGLAGSYLYLGDRFTAADLMEHATEFVTKVMARDAAARQAVSA